MVVLDTNHLTVLTKGGPRAQRLVARLEKSTQEVVTSVVCVEERIQGWISEIRRRDLWGQVEAYREFSQLIETYARWILLPWDEEAANLFVKFRAAGVRIGTMDLKIACITITHDALLLTQNAADFAKVPGLRSEDWLE
ncbi:MAG TPA: type II toxin-antitoxin system VapC family toxin [Verrucomicrobiales bacterium]|nr:type II toxin-antitoxin system VapC family toxin [Verrucomicrobiales bacterium]